MGIWSSFRSKLLGLLALFAGGLIAVIALTQVAVGIVKVDGPLYHDVVREKALASDLVPAALTIRHPFLLLHKVCIEQEPAAARQWLVLFQKEEQDHQRLADEWLKKLPNGLLQDHLRENVLSTAREFFELSRREFMPLAEAGLTDPAKMPAATKYLRTRLRELYLKQMDACDRLAREVDDSVKRVEDNANRQISWWNRVLIGVSVGCLMLTLLVGWLVSRSILTPTQDLLHKMREIAGGGGDLTARVPVRADDEMGRLSTTINQVIQNVHDLVVQVRESSLSLFTSATEIAATSREQEATMHNLGASTTQIAAAVKEISATSAALSGTVNEVTDGAKHTGALAKSGKTGLAKMEDTMQQLADSTGGIAGKLSAVREKANDITAVVTTITKVADQTNLLSINAAIEAEKAGEYGRGFLVVAREIRRLADQTAVATLDIENMVRQMQSAVSAGVMEMDRFAEEVRSAVSGVKGIGGQMGQILEQVQGLNERFQVVNEGTAQQSAGARQINDAMLQLAAGVQQTSASAKEFQTVTDTLRSAADTLRDRVARFKVGG